MRVYWRTVKRGQNLILNNEADGSEERIGGFRETKTGIDAYATTFGYDPGRSQKGFSSIEEAKAFVESFSPWELYESAQGATVELEVLPLLEPASESKSDAQQEPVTDGTPEQPADVIAPDQPDTTNTPEQPADIIASDQPDTTNTPEQPADIIASDQPDTTNTPEQPADVIASDQPDTTNTAEQPAESIAPDPQPSKRWWEFWKAR